MATRIIDFRTAETVPKRSTACVSTLCQIARVFLKRMQLFLEKNVLLLFLIMTVGVCVCVLGMIGKTLAEVLHA